MQESKQGEMVFDLELCQYFAVIGFCIKLIIIDYSNLFSNTFSLYLFHVTGVSAASCYYNNIYFLKNAVLGVGILRLLLFKCVFFLIGAENLVVITRDECAVEYRLQVGTRI